MLKEYIERLVAGEVLSRDDARSALRALAAPESPPPLVASFLTAYRFRSVTVQELGGFRDAMLELATPVRTERQPLVDICGTGGDGKDTFNISTAASFVIAGAGVSVAKHGNYGFSSKCGSSNVLEALGVTFPRSEEEVVRDLERSNISFLHAPYFHPATKRVAEVRRERGIRTVFNLLGPIVNPASPTVQVIGVAPAECAELYKDVLGGGDSEFAVLYSCDGYDEVSLTGKCVVMTRDRTLTYQPGDFELPPCAPGELVSKGDAEANARLVEAILRCEATASQINVVVANAALGISLAVNCSLVEGVERARESILSGGATKSLEALRTVV